MAGTVKPAHSRETVRITLSKLGPEGRFARISSRSVTLRRDSSYRTHYPVPDPGAGGTYRATARFVSDGDHASASSERVTFVIDPSS
jgi:hypothetical protein